MSYPAVLTSSGHPGFEDLKRLTDILGPARPRELFHGSRLSRGLQTVSFGCGVFGAVRPY